MRTRNSTRRPKRNRKASSKIAYLSSSALSPKHKKSKTSSGFLSRKRKKTVDKSSKSSESKLLPTKNERRLKRGRETAASVQKRNGTAETQALWHSVDKYSPLWKTFVVSVNSELQKIRFYKTMINAYEREGWKSANLEKMRPVKELEKAESKVISSKKRIKELLKELCEGPDALKERVIKLSDNDSDSGVDASEILCSICKTGNSTDENDIVMCDLEGCNKAFHQKCCVPEVTQAELENSDDWFCRRCFCKLNILNAVNDEFESDYEGWRDMFAGDFEEYEQKKLLKEKQPFRGAWDTHSFGSETDEEDWDGEDVSSSSGNESLEDIDENPLIITTKRVKKQVDYRKLNDELFTENDEHSQEEGDDEYSERNSSLIESATLKSIFGKKKNK
mmetsp:Transcript_14001/g.16393  ORF Transcript_14001/g.16393 Transcript_14001/m.16393 type:complete len:392 (-) Transcript_14001:494-1669(-)|eukprot:CAMPEP_0184054454 /NCGR_PEP_ID=MMETSP0956-20121227/6593_1 /TAXON_ID=627963 /ORGANISM="Aplanochytrium sp, Strain PBS07" /LENGTH=391 /DNA_ID=CAMNT_0026348095 /DNA_START=108 /DNA_END=1283 /DNA_ORIENTATION=-